MDKQKGRRGGQLATRGAKSRGKRDTQTSGGHGRKRKQARGPRERPAASPPTAPGTSRPWSPSRNRSSYLTMLSCLGGLHESPMLVSDLASARKFMGWPGTGGGRGTEMGEAGEASPLGHLTCPVSTFSSAACVRCFQNVLPLFLLLLFSQGTPHCPLVVSCPPQFCLLSASNGKNIYKPPFQITPAPSSSPKLSDRESGGDAAWTTQLHPLLSVGAESQPSCPITGVASVFPDLGFRKPEPMRKGPETCKEPGPHIPRRPPYFLHTHPRRPRGLLAEWPEPSPLPLCYLETGGVQLSRESSGRGSQSPTGSAVTNEWKRHPSVQTQPWGAIWVSACSPVG